jgi:hypothetical protein
MLGEVKFLVVPRAQYPFHVSHQGILNFQYGLNFVRAVIGRSHRPLVSAAYPHEFAKHHNYIEFIVIIIHVPE